MSKYVTGLMKKCHLFVKHWNLRDIHGYPGYPIDAATANEWSFSLPYPTPDTCNMSANFKHKSGGWRGSRWPSITVVLYLFNAQKEITHKAQHCYLLHTVALTVPCSPRCVSCPGAPGTGPGHEGVKPGWPHDKLWRCLQILWRFFWWMNIDYLSKIHFA